MEVVTLFVVLIGLFNSVSVESKLKGAFTSVIMYQYFIDRLQNKFR
jgi:hypothetical protein